MKDRYILAFETSCDETSVAVLKNDDQLLSNVIASQIESHKRFGGVVPEVASRHHVEVITACIEEALEEAGITEADVTAVAVTYGPGLVGALLVGLAAAKAFAWAHGLPLIPVNHMAGHLMAAQSVEPLEFPLLALLVSGGHTELVYVSEAGDYKIVGETRDDAVGEAYDKVGRVMGLTYPAGREIDQLAHQGADIYDFPRAMIKEGINGIIDKDDGDVFAAVEGMNSFCRADAGQVAIALIGEHQAIGPQTFHTCCQSRRATMRRFLPINVDIAVGKDGTAHGTDAHSLVFHAHLGNHLGH